MSSRLLKGLEARIARTRDLQEKACLRAEKAALLARQGDIEGARSELVGIHALYDGRPNAVVSAWVNFAEGLVVYFSSLGPEARDKLKRSLAISEAIGARSIQALSAAWLAQIEFAKLDFDPMLRHLSMALECAAINEHSALSRSCLVIADSYHWGERIDLALPWYARARRHASFDGDEATMSALMHNMAWMRVAEARRRSIANVLDVTQARDAQLGAESVFRFDELVGNSALGSLVPILRAQVFLLHERYAEALELFESHIDGAVAEGLDRMACVMLADAAWCRHKLGADSAARRDATASLSRVIADTDVDDRAMTHSRLSQYFAAVGDFEISREHASLARAAWELHVQKQTLLLPRLDSTVKSFLGKTALRT